MSIESPQHQKKDVTTPSKTEAARAVFPETKDREGFTKGQKIAGTAFALSLLAGGGIAAHHFSSQNETIATPADENNGNGETIAPTPSVSVDASPSASPSNITPLETAAPTLDTKEQLIASLELSAEKYPDVASLGKAIMVDRYTAWKNQGASQEVKDEYMDPSTNKTADAFAAEKIKEIADVFPKALYVENYKEIPVLAKDAATENEASEGVLARKLITWNDDAPYERAVTLSSEPKLVAGSIESGEVTFTVSWVDSSNAADNKIGTKYDPNDVHPYVGTRTITTVNVDGNWKIADIKF